MPDMKALLARVAALVAPMAERAAGLDREGGFPTEDLAALREAGALLAPVPARMGGMGLGTEAAGASGLAALLGLVGRGSLAVGRVLEGHVNALKLVALYGTEAQLRRAAEDAAAGHLFGLWNTELAPGVRLEDGVLRGRKVVCSAAGQATRALVTAAEAGGTRMVVVALAPGERVLPGRWTLQGMRAAGTAGMELEGVAAPPDAVIGAAGDYLRQPEFSAGAWRTSAVTLGGLEALLAATRAQLVARGRAADPHQLARIGEALIAQESARMWVARAAEAAEGGTLAAQDVAGIVNLARIAVERACLDAMRLVTRSLGLQAMLPDNPVERIGRDLATYLRQPAPDETLTEAAAWFMTRDLPA